MEDSKAGNIDRQAFKEEIRKRTIKDILWSKRRAPSSKQILHHEMIEEEDKEVKLEEPQKGYLPLNQHQKHHYHHRKKKKKKCWKCYSCNHLKRDCPYLRCFYCGRQGHIKKKCWKYELHIAVQELKRATKEEPNEKRIKTKKKKNAYDRMKEVVFRQEGKDFIMNHKDQDLGVYIGEKPFKEAQRFFEPPKLPKWQLDKAIKSDHVDVSRLKVSDHLPCQCGSEGEVLNGKDFLLHCKIYHRGWVPKGSLINGSPYRYWILWYDDRNFVKFFQDKGEIQYIKAKPPWIC